MVAVAIGAQVLVPPVVHAHRHMVHSIPESNSIWPRNNLLGLLDKCWYFFLLLLLFFLIFLLLLVGMPKSRLFHLRHQLFLLLGQLLLPGHALQGLLDSLADCAFKVHGRLNFTNRALPLAVERCLEARDAVDMLAGHLARFGHHLETDGAVGVDFELYVLH